MDMRHLEAAASHVPAVAFLEQVGGTPQPQVALVIRDVGAAIGGGLDAITETPCVWIVGRCFQRHLGVHPGIAVARRHQRDPGPVLVGQPVVGHVHGPEVGASEPVVHGERREASGPGRSEMLDERRRPGLAHVVAVSDRHRQTSGDARGVAGPEASVRPPGDDRVDVAAVHAPWVVGPAPGSAAVARDPNDRPPAAGHAGRQKCLGSHGHDSRAERIGGGGGLGATSHERLTYGRRGPGR